MAEKHLHDRIRERLLEFDNAVLVLDSILVASAEAAIRCLRLITSCERSESSWARSGPAYSQD